MFELINLDLVSVSDYKVLGHLNIFSSTWSQVHSSIWMKKDWRRTTNYMFSSTYEQSHTNQAGSMMFMTIIIIMSRSTQWIWYSTELLLIGLRKLPKGNLTHMIRKANSIKTKVKLESTSQTWTKIALLKLLHWLIAYELPGNTHQTWWTLVYPQCSVADIFWFTIYPSLTVADNLLT